MVQFNLDVPDAQYIGTEQEASVLLQRLLNKVDAEPDEFIGFDTETHGKKIPLKPKKDGGAAKSDPLDWMQDTVTFWSLAAKLEQYERWCLPVQLLHRFIPLLEYKRAQLALWNAKYDAHVCYNSGLYIFGATVHDGLVMASLVDENLQGHLGLKEVAAKEHSFFHPKRKIDRDTYWEDMVKAGRIEEWVPIPMTKFTDLFPKKDPSGKKIVEYEYSIVSLFQHYPDRVADYASLDAYATLRLCEHLRDLMRCLPLSENESDGDMWDYYLSMEVDITEILWRMERRGLGINLEYLNSIRGPITDEMNSVVKQIWQLAGWPVNLNSVGDLIQLLFGAHDGVVKKGKNEVPAPGLGLEPLKYTKGGKTKLPTPCTDAAVLEELAAKGVEVAKLLVRNRTLQKIRSTYVEAIIRLCEHHEDHRLHPSFKQAGARTGRFSTATPNCYDGETEVLTRAGWVRFDALKAGVEVMQWTPPKKVTDKDLGSLNFVVPSEIQDTFYEGDLIELSSPYVNLSVTPNHRCPIIDMEGVVRTVHAENYPSGRIEYYQLHSSHYREGRVTIPLAALEKREQLGPWVFGLSQQSLTDLLSVWEKSLTFDTSQEDLDWIQSIAVMCGRVLDMLHLKELAAIECRASSTVWIRKYRSWPHPRRVYCVTVPASYIVVRRKGRVCISGNSQNFPRPDTDEFKIRSAFVAPPGKVLIVADYSTLEMLIMADRSQDEGMLAAIRSGLDLHCVTAEKMFGIPYADVAKAKKLGTDREKVPLTEEVLKDLVSLGEESNLAACAKDVLQGQAGVDELADLIREYVLKRQQSKTVGFGIIYGAGGKTIGLQLEIPKEDAQELIDLYFEAFPGVRDFMESTVANCSQDEYVTTLVGRRRRLPDINHHQFTKRSHAEREATNAKVQGGAADIVKAAMINIENDEQLRAWGVCIINQIHDELVSECPKEYAELAAPRIQHLMEKAFNGEDPLCVPTPCDVKIVPSWDKAK